MVREGGKLVFTDGKGPELPSNKIETPKQGDVFENAKGERLVVAGNISGGKGNPETLQVEERITKDVRKKPSENLNVMSPKRFAVVARSGGYEKIDPIQDTNPEFYKAYDGEMEKTHNAFEQEVEILNYRMEKWRKAVDVLPGNAMEVFLYEALRLRIEKTVADFNDLDERFVENGRKKMQLLIEIHTYQSEIPKEIRLKKGTSFKQIEKPDYELVERGYYNVLLDRKAVELQKKYDAARKGKIAIAEDAPNPADFMRRVDALVSSLSDKLTSRDLKKVLDQLSEFEEKIFSLKNNEEDDVDSYDMSGGNRMGKRAQGRRKEGGKSLVEDEAKAGKGTRNERREGRMAKTNITATSTGNGDESLVEGETVGKAPDSGSPGAGNDDVNEPVDNTTVPSIDMERSKIPNPAEIPPKKPTGNQDSASKRKLENQDFKKEEFLGRLFVAVGDKKVAINSASTMPELYKCRYKQANREKKEKDQYLDWNQFADYLDNVKGKEREEAFKELENAELEIHNLFIERKKEIRSNLELSGTGKPERKKEPNKEGRPSLKMVFEQGMQWLVELASQIEGATNLSNLNELSEYDVVAKKRRFRLKNDQFKRLLNNKVPDDMKPFSLEIERLKDIWTKTAAEIFFKNPAVEAQFKERLTGSLKKSKGVLNNRARYLEIFLKIALPQEIKDISSSSVVKEKMREMWEKVFPDVKKAYDLATPPLGPDGAVPANTSGSGEKLNPERTEPVKVVPEGAPVGPNSAETEPEPKRGAGKKMTLVEKERTAREAFEKKFAELKKQISEAVAPNQEFVALRSSDSNAPFRFFKLKELVPNIPPEELLEHRKFIPLKKEMIAADQELNDLYEKRETEWIQSKAGEKKPERKPSLRKVFEQGMKWLKKLEIQIQKVENLSDVDQLYEYDEKEKKRMLRFDNDEFRRLLSNKLPDDMKMFGTKMNELRDILLEKEKLMRKKQRKAHVPSVTPLDKDDAARTKGDGSRNGFSAESMQEAEAHARRLAAQTNTHKTEADTADATKPEEEDKQLEGKTAREKAIIIRDQLLPIAIAEKKAWAERSDPNNPQPDAQKVSPVQYEVMMAYLNGVQTEADDAFNFANNLKVKKPEDRQIRASKYRRVHHILEEVRKASFFSEEEIERRKARSSITKPELQTPKERTYDELSAELDPSEVDEFVGLTGTVLAEPLDYARSTGKTKKEIIDEIGADNVVQMLLVAIEKVLSSAPKSAPQSTWSHSEKELFSRKFAQVRVEKFIKERAKK